MFSTKYLVSTGLASAAVVASLAAPALATVNTDHVDWNHKVGICHATGSKTNPYVFIVVDKHAAEAHKNHQDGRDIIGVKSDAQCPKPHTSTPSPTPTPTKGGSGNGQVLGSSDNKVEMPSVLPETGATAGLSALIGVPAMAVAGREYLRSRRSR